MIYYKQRGRETEGLTIEREREGLTIARDRERDRQRGTTSALKKKIFDLKS